MFWKKTLRLDLADGMHEYKLLSYKFNNPLNIVFVVLNKRFCHVPNDEGQQEIYLSSSITIIGNGNSSICVNKEISALDTPRAQIMITCTSIIFSILKKEDPEEVTNNRTKSLTSVAYNSIERIIKKGTKFGSQ